MNKKDKAFFIIGKILAYSLLFIGIIAKLGLYKLIVLFTAIIFLLIDDILLINKNKRGSE